MPDHLPLLVVDKSYAHAVTAAKLKSLEDNYVVLVPTAFYWEVFDTEPEKRIHTLTGFPEFRRIHVPRYLQMETQKGEPVVQAEQPRLSFNPKVLDPNWQMEPEELKVMEDHHRSVVEPAIEFWKMAISAEVGGFTQSENASLLQSDQVFLALCQKLRLPEQVLRVGKAVGYKYADRLDPSWFHYRFYQAMAFQGLVLRWRHKGSATDVNPRKLTERLEHDAQDLEYLLLGLLVGHLATAETSEKLGKASMGWRFKLLEPNATLLTPARRGDGIGPQH